MVRSKREWQLTQEQTWFLSGIITQTTQWVVDRNYPAIPPTEKKWEINPRYKYPREEGWFLPSDLVDCISRLQRTSIAKVRSELNKIGLLETAVARKVDRKRQESQPIVSRLNVFEDGREGFRILSIYTFECPSAFSWPEYNQLFDTLNKKYGHATYFIERFLENLGYDLKNCRQVYSTLMGFSSKPFVEFLKNGLSLDEEQKEAIRSLHKRVMLRLGEGLACRFTAASLAYTQCLTALLEEDSVISRMRKIADKYKVKGIKRNPKDAAKDLQELSSMSQGSIEALRASMIFEREFDSFIDGLRQQPKEVKGPNRPPL